MVIHLWSVRFFDLLSLIADKFADVLARTVPLARVV
jgi:hypothetical protein